MTTYDAERITYFAETDARGKRVPFGIRAKDRTRHVYVIGKSGMGKSTLLENMAVQDIRNGEGFAFIDPHGGSAEAIMHHIPEERLDDVLYFNPSDLAHPIAFNVLEDVEPDKRFLVVSGLMSVFKKIWVDAWSARMEYILQYTLLALLEYPGATLLGVNRMLSEKGYRDEVVSHVTDPGVKAYWEDEFAKYSERYMQEAGDAIKNKIGQFTSNPVVRNIVGQPKTSFDIRKMMDEQKILIVNLSKGLVGESNANLLGSMLTTRIYLAAMSRADLSAREMAAAPNFYFYVDEFQSFANATFANILSEARKYKLNLTIAHQYVDQMEEDVRNAVFGNVGTTITFRVGPLDAEVLEKLFMPEFTATDIVNLGFAQIYLTLMIDGIGSPPFSARTLKPIEEPERTYYDVAIARSRARFASAREEVQDVVSGFYAAAFGKGKGEDKKKKGDRTLSRTEGHAQERQQHKADLRAILQGITDQTQDASPAATNTSPAPAQKKFAGRAAAPEGSPAPRVSTPGETSPTSTDASSQVRGPKSQRHESGLRQGHRSKKQPQGGSDRTPREARQSSDRGPRGPEKRAEQSELKSALASALAGITLSDTPMMDSSAPAAPTAQDERVAPDEVRETALHREEVMPQKDECESTLSNPMNISDVRKGLDDRADTLGKTKRAPHDITPKALAHMMRIGLKDKKRRPQ